MKKLFSITILPLLLLGLVACGGSGNNSSGLAGPTASDTGSTPAGGSTGGSTGGTNAPANEQPQSINRDPQPGGNFLDPFPLNQIVSGGVPKDGIPAIDEPHFIVHLMAGITLG